MASRRFGLFKLPTGAGGRLNVTPEETLGHSLLDPSPTLGIYDMISDDLSHVAVFFEEVVEVPRCKHPFQAH